MRAFADPPSPLRRQRPGRRRRAVATGFSFTEVLFAVMILGIGFIMVAAIFPVAIQQAQTASDESVSAAIAWNAMAVIESKLSGVELPAAGAPEYNDRNKPFDEDVYPGIVRSFRDPQGKTLATLVKGQPNGANRPKPTATGYMESTDPAKQVDFAQPRDYLWDRIKGESVVVDDRRFGWVAFYRRHIIHEFSDEPATYAQLIVVVVRARDSSTYGKKDVTGARIANLQPRPVQFDLTSDGDGPKVDQVVTFTRGAKDAVAEGAYLLVAHDNLPAPSSGATSPAVQGALNCHVFRIGNRVAGDTWELSPDADFAPRKVFGADVTGASDAEGYVVGRTNDGGAYDGVSQDIAVYTMIIPAH